MNTELAKMLTIALVQFLDRERPEGAMCCSNTDCENIKGAFEEGEYGVIESFIQNKLSVLTEFERAVDDIIRSYRCDSEQDGNGIIGYQDWIKRKAKVLIEIAKKELCNSCTPKEMDETPFWPSCYLGGNCTNPFRDCINCPRRHSTIGINTTTGTSSAKVEG